VTDVSVPARPNAISRFRGLAADAQAVWPVAAAATAVLAIAAVGTTRIPAPVAALTLSVLCLITSPTIGAAIVLVAANDPHLFREGALGSLTAVDAAIVSTLLRAALRAERRLPSPFEWFAIGFLVAGAVGTTIGYGGSAPTAFARVASYLVLGLAVGRAVGAGGRRALSQAFVGAASGQAIAAMATLTPAIATRFPFGRFVGTLRDPAQFGIPIAVAALLLAFSPRILPLRGPRYALTLILAAGVVGSVTRSAWAVLATGFLAAALIRIGRRRSAATRVLLGLAGVLLAAVAAVSVTFGASALGLSRDSASVRTRSVDAAWTYLIAHPLHPVGLGTRERVTPLPTAIKNPLLTSNFEVGTSDWRSFRDVGLSRVAGDSSIGHSSLQVTTPGETTEEGITLPLVALRPLTRYTFSFDAKIPRTETLWSYFDEYDADDRWLTYHYVPALGAGAWQRYSSTFRTDDRAIYAKIYIVTPAKAATTFLIDGVQLEHGAIPTPFTRGRDIPPTEIIWVSETYNTWLAVAIALGIATSALLAALAISAPYSSFTLGDRATGLALGALLIPSTTENFVYGANLVTLVWFFALGLAVTVKRVDSSGPSKYRGLWGKRDR
jgi:Carbohydrate binding domain/O-Antigen ligase